MDYPFCYSSCFTLNTMSIMNAENIEASCSAHHLPVMLPHQSVYASEDVVSLASATHGILFSIPLLLNSQLSNFLISSTAVCLLSVETNEYDLCAFQIPPQWPAKWKRSILKEDSIFFFLAWRSKLLYDWALFYMKMIMFIQKIVTIILVNWCI